MYGRSNVGCKWRGVAQLTACVHYSMMSKYEQSGFFSPWGRDGSVCIATCYGLDGPGIESWWGQDFLHPSRPALGPTQRPIEWVLCLFRG